MNRQWEVPAVADALLMHLTSKMWHFWIGALMLERRVIIVGETLQDGSECIHGAIAAPLQWHHIFIPLVPDAMLDHLAAPSPYFVGLLRSQMPKVRKVSLGDAVLVFLKTNEIEMTREIRLCRRGENGKGRDAIQHQALCTKSLLLRFKRISISIRSNVTKRKLTRYDNSRSAASRSYRICSTGAILDQDYSIWRCEVECNVHAGRYHRRFHKCNARSRSAEFFPYLDKVKCLTCSSRRCAF